MNFRSLLSLPSIHVARLFIALMVTSVALVWCAASARAVSLIRDPDIEYALKMMSAPILNAAGLGGNVNILIVNDTSLNAFVIDANSIYIHSGMLAKLDTPEKLQAVIAHEAAHISNGHIARRMANLQSARSLAGFGLALALAAAAATGRGDLGFGLVAGSQSLAQRQFLAHSRAEEASADQSGIRYLASSGIDPSGAVEVHKMFVGQELLNVSRQDPYVRSHPLSRDRVRAMERFVTAYSGKSHPQPEMDYWYERARGKLTAFVNPPKWTLKRSSNSNYEDVRRMREAIAYHRMSDYSRAVSRIDDAIALRPNDAFYFELKGQIQLEARKFQAAVSAYRRAAELASTNALILGGLGRALLTVDRPEEALPLLEQARNLDFRDGRILRDLGSAYAKTGQNGMASLAVSERFALAGRLEDAEIHARRASGLLPRGSGPWRRAEDILIAAKRAAKK